MNRALFVYGVLTFAEVRHALGLRAWEDAAATMPGFCRRTLKRERGCPIPLAVPCPGSSVAGLLLRGVDRRSLRLMDRFEEVGRGCYVRHHVAVWSKGRIQAAQAYLAVKAPSGTGQSWSPTLFRERYLRRYLEEVVVPFTHRRWPTEPVRDDFAWWR